MNHPALPSPAASPVMADNDSPAPYDQWEQLMAHVDRVKRLDEESYAVILDCGQHHNTIRVWWDCGECWAKLIVAYRSCFLEPSGQVWFAGRTDLVQELEDRFEVALGCDPDERSAHFAAIDGRIQQAKREWLRAAVMASAAVNRLAEEVASKEEFQSRLHCSRVHIRGLLDDLLGMAAAQHQAEYQEIRELADRLRKEEERIVAVRDVFLDRNDPTEMACELAAEMVGEDADLEDDERAIMFAAEMVQGMLPPDEAVEARLARQMSEANEREKWVLRLEELLRAKAAHQAQQIKRMREVGQSYSNMLIPRPLPDALAEPTSCDECGRDMGKCQVFRCPLCTLFVLSGIQDHLKTTCSHECAESSTIPEPRHACRAGNRCVLRPHGIAQREDLVACYECVFKLDRDSVYCQEECAGRDFQRHREEIHMPEWEARDMPIPDLDKLDYVDEEENIYHAKNISEHVMGIPLALVQQWRKYAAEEPIPLFRG